MKDLGLLDGYQLDSALFVVENPKCALWMLMGRGKTISVLTALNYLQVKRILVIAPPIVAKDTWREEIEDWKHIDYDVEWIRGPAEQRKRGIARGATIQTISVHNTEWLCDTYNTKELWCWDVLIIDESGYFRTFKKKFKALRHRVDWCDRIILLTGTPAANSYEGLYTQFYLLDKGERLGKNITAYRREHFVKSWDGFRYEIKGPDEHLKIKAKIADITHVVEADDKGMPDLIEREIRVSLPPKFLKLYKQFARDKYIEIGDDIIEAEQAGVLINKLLQFSSGQIYFQDPPENEWDDPPDRRVIDLGDNSKIKKLEEIIESQQGRPLLVGYNYGHEADRIREIKGVTIYKDDKKNSLGAFKRGELPVLASHPASIGHGLNLQHNACDLLWFSLPWDNEVYRQFNFRLWRKGQKNTVTINHLVVPGTVELLVLKKLGVKEDAQQKLIKAVYEHINDEY